MLWLIALYVIPFISSWFLVRYLNKSFKQEPTLLDVLFVITPFVNLIITFLIGAIWLADNPLESKFARKFFNH